jgi:hypothetical protein
VCAIADPRVLRLVELADGEVTLCANDATIAGRLGFTLEQLREEARLGGARDDLGGKVEAPAAAEPARPRRRRAAVELPKLDDGEAEAA